MKTLDLKKRQSVSFEKQENTDLFIKKIVRNESKKTALIFAETKDGLSSVIRNYSSIVKVNRKWIDAIEF